MKLVQTNDFQSLSLTEDQSLQLIDIFTVEGKKRIELVPHSSLVYLVLGSDIDLEIVSTGPHCSCKIFGLFVSDINRPIQGALTVNLDHAHTSGDVELISFLYDGAKLAIDGSIAIGKGIDNVHARLLEQNIVLGKPISLKTLPQLTVASHNVRASHGANIDTLDQKKLFYMMSRGLSQQQSQQLLVDGYIEYVLGHFSEMNDDEKVSIRSFLV